jgi:hypothetical protein
VDGKKRGVTPLIAALKQGERDIELRLAGYNPWRRRLQVLADKPQSLAIAALEIADGRVRVRTTPAKVSVTLDGAYQGQSPIEVAVRPGDRHRIGLSRAGYHPTEREVTVASGEEVHLDVELEPEIGVIKLVTSPEGAIVYVNGARRGSANQRLRLHAVPQRLEIRKPGFAPYRTTVTPHPGFEQELRVRLQPTGSNQR